MHSHDTFFAGAVRATKEIAARLYAVANDSTPAVATLRGQAMNSAFETIIIMGNAIDDDLDQFVIFVSADFASVHNSSPFRVSCRSGCRLRAGRPLSQG